MVGERFSLVGDIGGGEIMHAGMVGSLSPSRTLRVSSPPSDAVGVCADGGASCIIHTVSKFDTLAGVAIKYGVEVADIKRLNGLVTDLQMFALKTLQIPLPGRHPPSPCLSNGGDIPPRKSNSQQHSSWRNSDYFDSFPSLKLKSSSPQKVSSAPRYLVIKSAGQNDSPEGFEMAVYQKGLAHYLENGYFAESETPAPLPLSQHRKSKSTANFLVPKNGQEALSSSDSDKLNENLLRRRQKSVGDFTSHTPEKLQEETTNPAGKGLVHKSKSASQTVSGGVDGEAWGGLNPGPIGLMDSFLNNVVSVVRKSSSASSLPDSDNGSPSFIWPKTRWSLKPDFQALSTVAIAMPILDGLAKPTSRRNKAAVD